MAEPVQNIFIQVSREDLEKLIRDSVSNALAKQAKPTETGDRLYTRQQAAQMLDVDLATLSRWNRTHKLPAYGIGNRVYYREQDIKNALQKI